MRDRGFVAAPDRRCSSTDRCASSRCRSATATSAGTTTTPASAAAAGRWPSARTTTAPTPPWSGCSPTASPAGATCSRPSTARTRPARTATTTCSTYARGGTSPRPTCSSDLEAGAQFALAADGRMAIGDEGTVQLWPLGFSDGRAQALSPAGATAGDIALSGTTLYWTETPQGAPPVARSAQLSGDPPRPRPARAGRDPSRRLVHAPVGHDRVQSSRVRVLRRGADRRLPLRRRAGAAAAGGHERRRPADRRRPLAVRARRRGCASSTCAQLQTVTRVGSPADSALLDDGRCVDRGRRPAARRRAGAAPRLAATGASALAASRTTVYWTGVARPSASRRPGRGPGTPEQVLRVCHPHDARAATRARARRRTPGCARGLR